MERIYLDYNATAPLRPQAREAMLQALDLPGNPSSVHGEGRAVRRLIDEARALVQRVFQAAGGQPEKGLRPPEFKAALEGAKVHLCVDVPIED
jgi:hypothetical protein